MEKNELTKWHRAYIQNAYHELEQGITRKQLGTLNIKTTDRKVLDVGCGPGNLLVALSADTPQLLVGVDVDTTFLTLGRSKIEKLITPPSKVPTLICASLPTLPFADETFDLVTCFLVMPHVPDDKVALTELARVLKPGGTLAISGHGLGFPLRYLKRFRLKPLRMYLASLIYRCTGKKWIRNTLQNEKQICNILSGIGLTIDVRNYNKKVLGCVATYWIRATKSETIPNATQ
ncbi:class I SAM-dependent methyltransferase [Candidatus Poribacteria bacterium]|nr:class I SAM-dependent methyltransferase [Candidatus Poribacteria bacterium]